jgi:hypothetical protein
MGPFKATFRQAFSLTKSSEWAYESNELAWPWLAARRAQVMVDDWITATPLVRFGEVFFSLWPNSAKLVSLRALITLINRRAGGGIFIACTYVAGFSNLVRRQI